MTATDFRSRRLPKGATVSERFWQKVTGSSVESCWPWMGTTTDAGYGRFAVDGVLVGAHRYAYTEMIGPIPDGLHLDHLCRVPACVNPWHLDPVTPRVNMHRGQTNATKTHCPQGHPYDEANTYRNAGRRMCRACQAVYQPAYRAARKAERAAMWAELLAFADECHGSAA